MTVYKGYMKILKQNKGLILLYLVIFFSVTMMFQSVAKNDMPGNYQAESVKIGVVDSDGGPLARELISYLKQFHKVTLLADDTAVMQEKLFYRDIEYIVRIPSGFFDTCIVNGQKLSVTKVPGSYTSLYVDTTGTAGAIPSFVYYYRYVPYLFLSVLCYVMGNILAAFRRGDLPKRMQASAVSTHRQNTESLLAAATIAIVLWAITIIASLLFYHDTLINHAGFIYYLINSLMMLLVALTISYLIGLITTNSNMLSGVVNVISLGMCFLCGTFVPLEYMNSGVKTAAQFLPVYWYEKTNDLLAQFGSITGEVRMEVLQALGIQLVFAVTFVCIAMAISKRKRTV